MDELTPKQRRAFPDTIIYEEGDGTAMEIGLGEGTVPALIFAPPIRILPTLFS
jgi:hypothetical protein